jgi:membrane-associated phospholipid phosphatase
MENSVTSKEMNNLSISGIINSIVPVIKTKYFWIGIFSLIIGAGLNFASQTYLHLYMSEGKTLPMLSDMILDNVPVVNMSIFYDIFCIVIFAFVVAYVVHRNQYNRIPFFLLMSGIFFIIRGIFIVLTPFGNPPDFNGSDPLFNGFSKYELGVYPSGHVGNSFLMLLLVYDKVYRKILWFCLAVIIITLIFSHGHYSIDILSGFFFAYAIKSFGEKHLEMFILKDPDNINR